MAIQIGLCAAILVVGFLIGTARSPERWKAAGILILAFVYAAWRYTQIERIDLTAPFSPQMGEFIGQVAVFTILAVGAAAIGNAVTKNRTGKAS